MTLQPQRSWAAALAIYLRAPVVTMLFLGFSAGLPFLLVFSTLTAWLRDVGVEVAAIGFFSWVGLTYSIKFLWAPVVDRLRLPVLCSILGQRRGWMLAGQVLIAGGLAGLAYTDPEVALGWVAAFALIAAFGSATQDVALDAFRIESAPDDIQAAMAAVYVAGYRIGAVLTGGGMAFWLAERFDWSLAYAVMAGLTAVGMIAVLVRPEPPRSMAADTREREQRVERFLVQTRLRDERLRRAGAWLVGAVVCPFVDFFARNGRRALLLLALVGLYKISDLAMAAMAYPLYIDLGFDKTTIANITKFLGLAVTVIGGMVGGLLTARYGIARMLILGAIIIPVANLVFALLAAVGDELPMLVATIVADNLSNGVASAVFIAFLSSLTSRAYTATQYALFSSLMTLPGKFLGGFSGFVVEWQGYPFFFITAAAMGIPAIFLAIWVARTGAGIQEHPDAPEPA